MGEVLRWTPLRHQMLARIAAGSPETGRIYRQQDFGSRPPRFSSYSRNPDRDTTSAAEIRTARDLYSAGLATAGRRSGDSIYSPRPLGLTESGSVVLAEWDQQHPEVAGG